MDRPIFNMLSLNNEKMGILTYKTIEGMGYPIQMTEYDLDARIWESFVFDSEGPLKQVPW